MSEERPRSSALQTYQAKCKAAEEALRSHFIALVRTTQRGAKMSARYLVYATDGNLGTFGGQNFLLFFTTPPGQDFKDVENLMDAIQQETRCRYDEADLHATIVLNGLSAYSRMTLEDWRDPHALKACVLSLDVGGGVRWMQYNGQCDYADAYGKRAAVFLVGCHDARVRRDTERLLRTSLIERKPTEAGFRKMLARLKRLTGLKRVGYIPLNA